MELEIRNLVSEIDLGPQDVLLPIFEVIVNSIISLQKANIPAQEKKIQIQIERGEYPTIMQIDRVKTIANVKVIDNGEGFNDSNLLAYKKAYTRNNKEYGCKGIGRFTVLAAFTKISIESHFLNKNNNLLVRRFALSIPKEVHGDEEAKESPELKPKTIVTLERLYNKNLVQNSAMNLNEIAIGIMDHCLIYYLSSQLPIIEIIDLDPDSQNMIIVNDLYKKLSQERERAFQVRKHRFNSFILKTEKTNNRKNHYIHYCANSRVVGRGRNLSKSNSLFTYPIQEKTRSYFFDIYVVSELLNNKVYSARNGFRIPVEKETELYGSENTISFQEIEEVLSDILVSEYDTYMKATKEKAKIELQNYIIKEAVRYSRFKNRDDILDKIPPGLPNDKKEEFLHRFSFQETKKVEKKIQKLIDQKEISENSIQEIAAELKERASIDADNLAEYMTRRKAIIELFDKFLEADRDGKYKLEDDIHNLIFPMGITNQEVDYDSHNLWLLDERFATYSFVASDKTITSFSEKKSSKEPDMVLIKNAQFFDTRIGFAPKSSGELDSLVIFEFKRPGEVAHQKNKTNYSWGLEELVKKYFDEFLYGQDKKNYRGRPVYLQKETPKFGYIIVDMIPPKLEEYNIDQGFRKTPFGTLYKMFDNINLHLEVIKFETLLEFANNRHAPFFNKLFN